MFVDFPLGHTAGPPGDRATQRAIVTGALGLAHSASQPGHIESSGHQWHEPWKDEARELIDHRTPRTDTPQYQEAADRVAAISNHGDAATCAVC